MTHNWKRRILPLAAALLLSLACGYAAHLVVPTATYDGPPQFEPVNKTLFLYAANSPQEILRVGNAYYLRDQGVWFASTTPAGPWQPARAVPREFKQISCTPIGGNNSPFDGDYQLCVGPLPHVKLNHVWIW